MVLAALYNQIQMYSTALCLSRNSVPTTRGDPCFEQALVDLLASKNIVYSQWNLFTVDLEEFLE